MDPLYENGYMEFNFRFSTSGYSSYFKEDSSAGLRVESIPSRQVPYCDVYGNFVFVEIVENEEEEMDFFAKDIDPLTKYRELLKKIDFSEIGTEKEILEEEIKNYFNQINYRKRATTLFVDEKEFQI